jgi:hypothetical protein
MSPSSSATETVDFRVAFDQKFNAPVLFSNPPSKLIRKEAFPYQLTIRA